MSHDVGGGSPRGICASGFDADDTTDNHGDDSEAQSGETGHGPPFSLLEILEAVNTNALGTHVRYSAVCWLARPTTVVRHSPEMLTATAAPAFVCARSDLARGR